MRAYLQINDSRVPLKSVPDHILEWIREYPYHVKVDRHLWGVYGDNGEIQFFCETESEAVSSSSSMNLRAVTEVESWLERLDTR